LFLKTKFILYNNIELKIYFKSIINKYIVIETYLQLAT